MLDIILGWSSTRWNYEHVQVALMVVGSAFKGAI
jgi:hypothetical protein